MQKSKKEVIKDLKINSKDVGSSEVQIGLLSEKINNLTNHLTHRGPDYKDTYIDKHNSIFFYYKNC